MMKPHYLKISSRTLNGFSVRRQTGLKHGGLYHFHNELELHLVVKGNGVRFIGDNIDSINAGDLILLGESLPHCWRFNNQLPENDTDEKQVEVIVLQFLPDSLGKQFINLPETASIQVLFKQARNGIMYRGETRTKVALLLEQLLEATDIDRLILFVKILKELAEDELYTLLNTATLPELPHDAPSISRINLIHDFTLSNYRQRISLKQVAGISNLTVTSFCRFFKLMTKKRYYDYLTEIRISQACRMLIEDKLTIPAISQMCGFSNLGNFYRHFKNVTQLTPFEYKKGRLHGKKVA